MSRLSTLQLYYDSSYFNPLQMQPHRVLELAGLGWAHWMAEFVAPFPELIREHRTGVAVVGILLRYQEPFDFFDGHRITVASDVRLVRDRTLQEVTTTVTSGTTEIATVEWMCRVLRIDDPETLSATPGRVPDHLAERFGRPQPEGRKPAPYMGARIAEITKNQVPLSSQDHTMTIGRGLCEMADQWWFAGLPNYLSASREQLIDSQGECCPTLRQGLLRPLKTVAIRLTRPLFVFDRATVTTSAYPGDKAPVFVHHITGPDGAKRATAVETMGET